MNPQRLFSLEGRAALISGASSGIGLHMARTFAEAGAKVVLCARRLDRIEEAAAVLRSDGLSAHAVALDVTRPEMIADAWVSAEQQVGQSVDILFNNAGVLYTERFIVQLRSSQGRTDSPDEGHGAGTGRQECSRQRAMPRQL